jgi:hypothetical protein
VTRESPPFEQAINRAMAKKKASGGLTKVMHKAFSIFCFCSARDVSRRV